MITKITPSKKRKCAEAFYNLTNSVNKMTELASGIESFELGKIVSDIERWSLKIGEELKIFDDALQIQYEIAETNNLNEKLEIKKREDIIKEEMNNNEVNENVSSDTLVDKDLTIDEKEMILSDDYFD